MPSFENGAVAARIRGLVSGKGSLSAVACRLRVDETALRMSVDELSPYPTMDVIVAVVREYAVDPHWLFTGKYDPSTHRASLNVNAADVPAVIRDVVEKAVDVTPHQLRVERIA